jgi:hypothetical protein
MRQVTEKWESDFFFALWDAVVMRALESEPRNIGYCAYLVRSELDVLLRVYKSRAQAKGQEGA